MHTHAPRIDRPADLDVVRESYDRVADDYAHLMQTTGMGDIRRHPWLKAAVDAFADTVTASGRGAGTGAGSGAAVGSGSGAGLGPVLDVGCGPGQVTAYLAERGLDVSGVDLSPGMIENARRLHPQCRFSVASATDLELDAESLGGVLGWWSLFNLPREVLPQVLASFARALKPGGHLLTATHAGEGDLVRTEAYGREGVRWTTHRWRPEEFAGVIEGAGLRVVADLRLAGDDQAGPGVVVMAKKPVR